MSLRQGLRVAARSTSLLTAVSVERQAPASLLPSIVSRLSSSASASTDDGQGYLKHSFFTGKPRSLAVDAAASSSIHEYEIDEKKIGKLRWMFLKLGGYYSNESKTTRAALRLKTRIASHAAEDSLLLAFGLPLDDFRARFSLLSIHLWMILVRLRSEGKPGQDLGQELYDHFWADMENRVRAEGVVVRLSKWMKELEQAFYGSSMNFDKCLKGDGDLAESMYRNVYMNEGDKRAAAILARYVRRELACLDMTDSEAVLAGRIQFSQDHLGVK